jgi:hypothetical protein
MKQLFFILGLLTQSLGYADSFPGGHEALVSITTAWIADDQSIDRDWIKVTPPYPMQRKPLDTVSVS